jgi:hypothetical protein
MDSITLITINGVIFAPTKKAVTESLFHGPVTASGTYRVTSGGINLYNLQDERIGGINRHGVLYRSFEVGGKLRHQCANPDGIPEYARYSQRCEEADEVLQAVGLRA